MANTVDLGSVYATLDLKTKNFESGIQSANSAMGGFKQTALGVFAGNLITQGVNAMTRTIVDFGKTALDTAGNMEQWRVAFDVMLGSADKAKVLLQQISDFAVKTPFELPQVVQGAKSLLAYNVSAEKIIPTFNALGNIAAGVGKEKLPQLILAFGQVKAATRLTGAELRQFTEAGVPLLEILAKQSGKTAAQIKEDMENGAAISFEEVEKALFSMSGEGGKFFNLMEKQSTTFQGTMSNVKDSITRFSLSLMGLTTTGDIVKGGLFDKIRTAAQTLQTFLADNSATISAVLSTIGGAIVNTVLFAFEAFGKAIAIVKSNLPAFVGALIGLGLSFGPALVGGIISATVAMGGFAVSVWAALAPLLPFIAIGAAVGIAVNALVERFSSWSNIGKKVVDVAKSIKNAFELMVTGDFKGGIFGLQEDSPFINALFVLRDILITVGNFVKTQFLSIWSSLKTIWAQLLESMKPLIDLFQEFWSKHGDKVLTVLKFIGIAIAAITLGPIVAGFALLLGALKVLAVVLQFVADHFDTIKKVVIAVVLTALSPLIIAVAAVIVAFNVIKTVVTTLYNVFVTVWNAIYTVVSTVVGFIVNVVVAYFQLWWSVVSGILNFMKDLFIIVFGSILIVVLTVLTAVKDFIIGVFTAIWDFVQPIVQAVVDFLGKAWDTVSSKVVAAFTAVKDFIMGIWNTIYGVISGIVQRIIDFFAPALSWLLQKGKDIVQGLINGIVSLAQGVWGAIKTVADKIGSFFAGAASWLYNAGKDVVQGLINGITGMAGKVAEAAQKIADTVKSKVKGLLGINSPSKVMAEYGKNTGQGFVKGLLSMQDTVAKVASNVFAMNDTGIFDAAKNIRVSPNSTAVLPSSSVDNSRSVTINGDVNVGNQADADYLLQRLSLRQDLTTQGLVGA